MDESCRSVAQRILSNLDTLDTRNLSVFIFIISEYLYSQAHKILNLLEKRVNYIKEDFKKKVALKVISCVV